MKSANSSIQRTGRFIGPRRRLEEVACPALPCAHVYLRACRNGGIQISAIWDCLSAYSPSEAAAHEFIARGFFQVIADNFTDGAYTKPMLLDYLEAMRFGYFYRTWVQILEGLEVIYYPPSNLGDSYLAAKLTVPAQALIAFRTLDSHALLFLNNANERSKH